METSSSMILKHLGQRLNRKQSVKPVTFRSSQKEQFPKRVLDQRHDKDEKRCCVITTKCLCQRFNLRIKQKNFCLNDLRQGCSFNKGNNTDFILSSYLVARV